MFLGKAQETLVVRGSFDNSTSTNVSADFQRNIFCYFKGGFIMPRFHLFNSFRVDSVISGSFKNFNSEINSTPFVIQLALFNECVILRFRSLQQSHTLQIKQFPHTNYYYISSLSQISPNEQYLEKLAEFRRIHQQNVNILTKGTLQERRDFLEENKKRNYRSDSIFNADRFFRDFRYISYILPYITSKDTITNYETIIWRGLPGQAGGERTLPVKGLYSDFLYDYLNRILPFALPPKTTDSIGWHKWYESLFQGDCFQYIKYAQSEHKKIASSWGISYFIQDVAKKHIYIGLQKDPFRHQRKSYVFNLNTDELTEVQYSHNCNELVFSNKHSIQNYEVVRFGNNFEQIELFTLDKFSCRQRKIIPFDNNIFGKAILDSRYFNSAIVHKENNFFVFWLDNTDSYYYLKAGKINRKGKWIIRPKILYKRLFENWWSSANRRFDRFSFHQVNKNETTIIFLDRARSQRDDGIDAIIVYKIDTNLNITDSTVIPMVFPLRSNDYISKTHLLKKDNTYFLLGEVLYNNGRRLYYKLLNDDLTPKTDFIRLANSMNRNKNQTAKPILTSEGFMITWVDNDLSENVVRSALIDTSGRQSDIINITNQRVDEIFNVEFDENHVDIYLFSRAERLLVRKRINKKEYNLQKP